MHANLIPFLLLAMACAPGLRDPEHQTPPPPTMNLSVDQMVPGETTTLQVLWAPPGVAVLFGRGDAGSGPCPTSLLGSCLGIEGPVLIGRAVADGFGVATLSMPIPSSVPPDLEVSVQAAAVDGSGATLSGVITVRTPPVVDITPQITAGGEFTCLLDAAGTPTCWGRDTHGALDAPPGPLVHITAGHRHVCGLDVDGYAHCWGDDSYGRATPPPGDTFTTLSAGEFDTCGIRTDGTIACWGVDDHGANDTGQVRGAPTTGTWLDVEAGDLQHCAIRTSGTAYCWGYQGWNHTTLPLGETFAQLTTGELHTCGIRTDGSIACWGIVSGAYEVGQVTDAPPTGTYVDIAAGWHHTCALDTQGAVTCWGSNDDSRGNTYLGQAVGRTGPYLSLASSYLHTCGIQDSGYISCWGLNDYGQSAGRWLP